ncbi:YtpI family protein [Heyndrickxia faecalis]|uniref:YtpI family protein n=1 Tax=Heyndrickxia faecalis TaxID=2824910 RepID=UPI003D1A94CA
MPILAVLILASISAYVYFKLKNIRSLLVMEKKVFSAKANMALGSFIFLFGVNELFLFHTAATYIIAAVFIVLGLFNIAGGFKRLRFYQPEMQKERDESRRAP